MIQNSQSGFSTLELLISITIIITALSAVILVVFSNQTVSLDNQVNNEALIKVNDLIEQARGSASFDFTSLGNSPTAVDDIFKKELMITDINPCKKTGIASVSWSTETSRPLQIELQTIFSNPSEAIALGGDCGPDAPTTGWENLICNDSYADWDDSPTLTPTGIDLIKRGSTTYAAISSNPSSGPRDDFYVVNVTNKTALNNPSEFTSLDLDPGLNDVDAVGNYVFAVRDDTDHELQVIDITNPLSPSLVSAASRSLSAVGAGSEGRKIFYHSGKVYIGTNYMISYNEFQIFDVSNPENPSSTPIGTFNVNHNINEIVVRNEVVLGVPKILAYLAVSGNNTNPKLVVLDVTNPGSVSQINSFSPSPNDVLYGTALHVLGDYVYLGRERATGAQKDIYFMDIDNINSPVYSEKLNLNNNNEVRDLRRSGPFLLMAVSKSNASDEDTFQVWDVMDFADIKKTKCNYPQDAVSFEFDGNFAYVINSANEALRIVYDASNPFP